MACDQLICLTLGHEYQPRRMSIEGGGDELLRLPVIGILAHGPGGWILLDTGLSPTMRDEPYARGIYRTRAPDFPTAQDIDPLVDALAQCGLKLDDLAAVAISHLHVDHTGGLRRLPAGRPVFVQRAELAFGLGAAGFEQAYIRADYAHRDHRWVRLDGDAELLPGVDAISTPGHTPGHMSFRVRMADGTVWLFAMDAIDLQDGIDTDTPIAGSAVEPEGIAQRHASHARLMAMAREEGARLVPGHCPRVWPTMPGPPRGVTIT
ncbi:MAG TPA: N-acyl homoserine lactonase family protein [Baekduia sp.]|nr:N-acyl homoserine lactonase family protein [Baekduia sp.]